MKKLSKNKKTLIFSALLLAAGKAFSAIGKIPLSAALGADGSGFYFAAFPLYGLIVSLSSGGISSCVSAFVAKNRTRLSDKTLAFLGFIAVSGSLVPAAALFFAADFIAGLQGLSASCSTYRVLCASVPVCAAAAAVRGAILGDGGFATASASELILQAVKAVCAPLFAFLGALTSPDLSAPFAAAGTFFAEIASLVFLLLARRKKGFTGGECDKKVAFSLLLRSMPVALTGIISPLSAMLDSFIVPGALSATIGAERAAAGYGIKEGVAGTLLSLPASVYSAAHTYFLPGLASENDKPDFTVVFGTFFFIGTVFYASLFAFADCAVSLLFPSLSSENAAIAVSVVRIGSCGALFSAITQAFTVLFHARGKNASVFVLRLVGAAARAIACAVLTPRLGIGGATLAQILSAAVSACLISLVGAIVLKPGISVKKLLLPALSAGLFCAALLMTRDAFSSLSPLMLALTRGSVAIAAAATPIIPLRLLIKRTENAPTGRS